MRLLMASAIDRAARSVLLESYIFKDDATGRSLLEALARAVERGVQVKVLADAFGSIATRRQFWNEMRDRGIEVRLFNPLFPQLFLQPFRDHRKILVIDEETAFTGGMSDPARKARRLVHIPPGRLAKATEIAQAALFLASDESSYVNGATFTVDGGITAAYVTPE